MEELIYNTAKGLIIGLLKALDPINNMTTKVNIQRIPRQILQFQGPSDIAKFQGVKKDHFRVKQLTPFLYRNSLS